MLVDRPEYYDLYRAVQADAAAAPVTVLVSAADCDACATFRTLRSLFKADEVAFSAFPVAGYEDLQRRGAELPRDAAPRCVVLINCGGTENLRRLLELDARPNTRCVVIDAHRPLDLDNVAESNGDVLVLRDSREQVPSADGSGAEAFPAAADDASGSDRDDDEDDGSGAEDGNDGEGASPQRRSTAAIERSSDSWGCVTAIAPWMRRADAPWMRRADAPHRGCDADAAGRRVRRRLEATERRVQREASRRARAEYYARGSFYGRPSACVAYDVAHALRRDGLEQHAPLWQAVLGLTDQYVHGRCGGDAYTAAVFELAGRVADAPGADAPAQVALDDGSTVAAFARRKVAYAREFRFPLLRHWSLHESMLASPYVATQLQTWSEQGRGALSRLLAECGLPLAECKQKFSHMSPAALRALKRLEEVAPRYGLGDVTFWSFTKRHGYKMDVCAADVVHGVTALLEAGGGAHGGDATGETAASAHPAADAADAGPGAAPAGAPTSAEGWFWRAVESMSESHWDTLRGGIAEAQRTHRAVMRQAGALLLGGKVALAGSFRLVNLAGGAAASAAGADAALLRRPATLLRLALLLQDATHAARRSHKPLVLAAPAGPAPGAGSPQSQATGNSGGEDDDGSAAAAGGMVLVVGVTGRPKRGDTRGNGFGASFHVAAAAVRAPFVHDAFEAAVISVAATHLRPFLLQLQDEELQRSAIAEAAAAEAAAAAAAQAAAAEGPQQPEGQA